MTDELTEWFSADCIPPLTETEWDPEQLQSEKLLIVDQTGEWYIGYYQQYTDDASGKWYQSGCDSYTIETTGPYRIRYWRYLKKDYPPLS